MAANNFIPKVIVITGASSGIGQALAEYYADDSITLALTGRNKDRLNKVAITCRNKGANVIEKIIDVTNQSAMEKWLHDIERESPVDMVIANAGISAGTKGVLIGEKPEQVRHVFDVNLNGVLNTITPLQKNMIKRGQGQIVIMSSLAGYRGWPGAPAYCGSKAAVKAYGEALRGSLKDTGVRVNVICPGFVKSRMTDTNQFPMPFLMDTMRAAKIIAINLNKNKGRITFPLIPSYMAWLFMIMPDYLAQYLLSFSPEK